MRARAMLALAAVTGALAATAAPASAQSTYQGGAVNGDAYCAQVRQNRMMIGGAIGAAVGAVLGNNLAARNAQTEGAGLGGVAGAATGAIIGRNTGACSVAAQRRVAQQGYQQPYAQDPYAQAPYAPSGYREPAYDGRGYGQQTGYAGDRYPLAGGRDYRNEAPGGGDPNCRWGTVSTRDPDGREVRDSIYMCRGRDGVWRPQQPY
ncbi:MAG: glycine zipper 2TM domain-containing protein [Hyphomonadaceae bacterium]|nr:glycine zipper 2TM domain-containing protein [Hyphomonadaceae bacterium]